MIIRWSKLRNIAEIEKHFGMINVDDCDFYYGLEFEIIRCTSEMKRKFLIFFVFRSVCTTFAMNMSNRTTNAILGLAALILAILCLLSIVSN